MFTSSYVSFVRSTFRSVSSITRNHQPRRQRANFAHGDILNQTIRYSNGTILWLLGSGQRDFASDGIRLLSSSKGADESSEEVSEMGGERLARKISENLGSYSETLAAPGVNLKSPNLIVTKWEALMNRCGLQVDRTASKEHQNAQKRKRSTVLALVFVAGSTFCGLLYFCIYYGWMRKDESSLHTGILAPYYRIKEAFRLWRNFVVEPSREKLLPDVLKPPYWQPKYTVVIELKNILVAPEWSYKMGNRVKKRPAVDYLLDVIGYPNFEVVIYTSETALNASPIVEALDNKQKIMYKLYRDCCKYMNGVYVKDLSKLNRDLSKVIYIDFDPESFQLNPENVLRLPKWEGTLDDTALVDLAELLKTIHLSDVDDVRPTLQYYSQFDDPLKEFRQRAAKVAELEKKMHQVVSEKEAYVAPVKKYQGRLFGFRRHE